MNNRTSEPFKEDYIYFTFRSITGSTFRVSVHFKNDQAALRKARQEAAQ